jgi:Fe-S cluster assembly iron-binding protein IscA
LALDEPNDADTTYENDGYTLVIERQVIEALGSISVDYIADSRGVGFDLRVTNADLGGCDSGSCGSGCH